MSPSSPNIPLPSLPALPDSVGQAPSFLGATDKRPQRKSPTASFLGSSDLPQQARGGWKTLIGT